MNPILVPKLTRSLAPTLLTTKRYETQMDVTYAFLALGKVFFWVVAWSHLQVQPPFSTGKLLSRFLC